MPLLELRCKTDQLPKSVVHFFLTVKIGERDRKKWEGGGERERKRERQIIETASPCVFCGTPVIPLHPGLPSVGEVLQTSFWGVIFIQSTFHAVHRHIDVITITCDGLCVSRFFFLIVCQGEHLWSGC